MVLSVIQVQLMNTISLFSFNQFDIKWEYLNLEAFLIFQFIATVKTIRIMNAMVIFIARFGIVCIQRDLLCLLAALIK